MISVTTFSIAEIELLWGLEYPYYDLSPGQQLILETISTWLNNNKPLSYQLNLDLGRRYGHTILLDIIMRTHPQFDLVCYNRDMANQHYPLIDNVLTIRTVKGIERVTDKIVFFDGVGSVIKNNQLEKFTIAKGWIFLG